MRKEKSCLDRLERRGDRILIGDIFEILKSQQYRNLILSNLCISRRKN